MKIEQIIYEGTTENMAVIRDITNLVVANLPEIIPIEGNVILGGYDLVATPDANYTLNDLIKKYPSQAKTLKYMEETIFSFPHYRTNVGVKIYGQYSYLDNEITINVAGIAQWSDSIEKKKLIDDKYNIYGLIPVLFHEIRHVFQNKTYDDHFYGKGRQGDYKQRDIEIDAMWHNILETYPIKRFKNAKAYATVVMNDLKTHRDITPKQEKHYWYKTIKYYLNPELDKPQKNTAERFEDYIVNKVPKNLLQLLSQRLPHDTRNNITEFDLRRLPSYSRENKWFLFPVPRVFGSVNNILSGKNDKPNAFQKNMVYLLASLVLTSGDKKIARDIAKYMTKVHNYTPQDAISNIGEGIPSDQWDMNQIADHMKSVFSV